jgi:NAD(P)H-dependent FMN reductase
LRTQTLIDHEGDTLSDLRIAIILGSTRPGRRGEPVANWVLEQAQARGGAQYDLIDLADYPLPHLDEAMSAKLRQYEGEHTKAWSAVIDQYDGYIFVTPEYNASISGVLKNAIDYLYPEWTNKAAAFVSYGAAGGHRAVQQLRTIAAELELAGVRQSLNFSLFSDFEAFTTFAPGPQHAATVEVLLSQVESWAGALQPLRVGVAA